jgi:serine/threonine protein kinase
MIGKTVSHYKIIEKLGCGGMGVVYKAEDTKLHRTVALKFLPHELTRDKEAKQRFIHEAQAASSLQHHNICTIHDIDETEDGQMFICMDSYDGETLKEKITKGPLKIDETINIAIQIAEGLQSAHEHGIIHRDIKPANIFITKAGEVKILDFGLAKLTGRSIITKMGSTVGTIAYMSPEQTRGENIDHRTDIWSFGIVLYEMLTGELPFKGDYEQAVIYSIINEEPEFISKIRSDVPQQIEKIISKSLNKDYVKRFSAVSEIKEALEHTSEEIKTGNVKTVYRFKLGRKQRRILYLLTAVLILFIAAIIYTKYNSLNLKTVSIALLPLQNISKEADQDWFTDGMTEALITDLAKISGL